MKNVTLEMSLKPFKKTDDEYIRKVCEELFYQWKPLVKEAESVSVMLWTADGSEILEYNKDLNKEFEWCRFIGGANPKDVPIPSKIDPKGLRCHARNYNYTDNPPKMTYGILKKIISTIKETGKEILGDIPIRVGETFDVGPEFAKSDFKYKKHPEICTGYAMGSNCMLCSYAKLHKDKTPYAGFPEGIEEGTPFGTFFGRQSQVFLTDMGFDYIWFSNGLGFGRDTWQHYGALFDGEKFDIKNLEEIKEEVLDFWTLFRKECPDFPIETRGTNLSMGIDFATDGVPLKTLYDVVEGLVPPVNSPWAALNGNFGLEIAGHLSRIAHLPKDKYFTFRYYIHDPWWINSPWYDRYGGEPHDIYLPAALSKIEPDGSIVTASQMNLLSVDNSYGELPDACAEEPIPHLKKAIKDMPDGISPVVWIYPFSEYSDANKEKDLNNMNAEDWYIVNAINNGAPVSQVMNTDDFVLCDKEKFKGSVIVTPVPKSEKFEKAIISYAKSGGKVIFYGNAQNSTDEFKDLCKIAIKEEITGEVNVSLEGADMGKMKVNTLYSSGGINTVSVGGEPYALADGYVIGNKVGNVIYLRATVSGITPGTSVHNTVFCDGREYFISESLLSDAISRLGFVIEFDKTKEELCPVSVITRYDNGYMFNVHNRNLTVDTLLSHPLGAPVLVGYETKIKDGKAIYRFPKAVHKECRVFVEQKDGIVLCAEANPGAYQTKRRLIIRNLKNATVRIFAEDYCKDNFKVLLAGDNFLDNSDAIGSRNFVTLPYEGEYVTDEYGTYFEARNITGVLNVCMPNIRDIKQDYSKNGGVSDCVDIVDK
ncbi:MAG: hypothetical protein E7396_00480 [Ruminococcaceae bacterium]|nr:hypothetical protein [Oscillospiraceae bacterium]